MQPINIDEIDYTVEYEGYLWYSGGSYPELINGQVDKSYFYPLARNVPSSLFIIEGNLYAHDLKRSIAIRNVDGQYLIHQADLATINPAQLTSQRYKSHRLGSIKAVEMVQYWDEVKDEDNLLEGMKTLVPAWTAFAGFIK